MSIFHKHNWIIIKETYAPPHDSYVKSAQSAYFERAFKGLTTILWECSTCKKIRKEEMLGKSI